MRVHIGICCEDWCNAQASGTGNEGYNHLLIHDGEFWRMGFKMPPIEYCPWCGAHKVDCLGRPLDRLQSGKDGGR